jgi:hypothetical protein
MTIELKAMAANASQAEADVSPAARPKPLSERTQAAVMVSFAGANLMN